MEKIFRLYDKVTESLSRIAGIIAGVCILIVAFIVVYEIIMRDLFNAPTEWVLEISTYLIIVAGFFGLAVTLRRRGHIQVDFLTDKFSPKTRCLLEILTTIFAAGVFFIFTIESLNLVATSYEFNKLSPSTLRFPLWIPQSSMILGSAFLFLELIRQLWAAVLAICKKDFTAFEVKGRGR